MGKRNKLHSPFPQERIYKKTPVLIVGEGATEEDYFKHLSNIDYYPNIQIKFISGDISKINVILKQAADYKHCVLLIDIDNKTPPERFNLITDILDNKSDRLNIYYNNYAFETFLLNHRQLFAKSIMYPRQYDEYFKRHFGVNNWTKNKNKRNRKTVTSPTVDEVDLAFENIKRINRTNYRSNPSSNMHKLDEYLKSIK